MSTIGSPFVGVGTEPGIERDAREQRRADLGRERLAAALAEELLAPPPCATR